ncbi:lipoate--protein ligase [Weeksellaceae bacterium KMM 9713]|uniref:lipoate--protein ligase n=1 Tax=Profundicola chukchiensis TaxID=2961959 RepID=A0A9X4MWU5_9FLAO|nr:lipoate--protein ligase [Profundicola chukchiensis]MDG4945454.1 lipoate--protein ligase [Profundicola chukchiensis]
MLIIESTSHDAYVNIASEEFLMKNYPDQDIFLLYVNAPSIIVGKFQNTLAEINLDYVKENNIKVVRRMSGGGAVYHDLGNLNFSFHVPHKDQDFMDFSQFTKPVVDMLNEMGVNAELVGRNDLLVDGKKFSGNAKLSRHGKIVQHGTILIDSEMEILASALKVNPLKFVDKATKSTRSRVTNLIHYLPEGTTTESFKKLLIDFILKENEHAKIHSFTEDEMNEIHKLVEEKYSTWDWNFGFSPNYNFQRAIKVPAGFIEAHIEVERGGNMKKVKIFGDFFASQPIEEFEDYLIGQNHDIDFLEEHLSKIDLTQYFGKVTVEEILPLFK